MTRKTYGRLDIGRVELEGGWFPGESWAIEVHAGYWPDAKRLCLMYLQVAKLCVSVGINLGPSAKAVAEWGEKFEAMAHREPIAPKAEEIAAARIAARPSGGICGAPRLLCKHCNLDAKGKHTEGEGFCRHGNGGEATRVAAARAWLAARGIPIEAPDAEEATE